MVNSAYLLTIYKLRLLLKPQIFKVGRRRERLSRTRLRQRHMDVNEVQAKANVTFQRLRGHVALLDVCRIKQENITF